MIDIHSHILHNIDDGAKDLDEAVAMARQAYDNGIRHIYATPHFNITYNNLKEKIRENIIELQQMLDKLNIAITIHVGNEVCMESTQFIYKHAEQDDFFYLDPSKKYILVEQTWTGYNVDSIEIIRWFRQQGTTPIIAHPERHFFFREDRKLLLRLIDEGVWTQVSVDSLLGKNNEDAKKFAFELMEEDLIHTIATDAHNMERNYNLYEGYQIITNVMGKSRSDEIKQRLEKIYSECNGAMR